MERRALGKGISALIPEREIKETEKVVNLKIEQIRPSRFQPRVEPDPEKMEELRLSIKEKGVIQPLLVRPGASGYELIAGERRLNAARSLRIEEIPAIVKDVGDKEALELSLIENIQREELSPIEEARAYQYLEEKFGFTQERIAQAVGRSRASIANTLRLLKLPEEIQESIRRGIISMGHARAILAIEEEREQIQLCKRVVSESLSVRELEILISRAKNRLKRRVGKVKEDPHLVSLEEELQHILGTKVRIIQGRKGGRIQIEYYSSEDLERILAALKSV